ncbi:hypothetical protein LCGC14_2635660, partial [marine sediment metagenome]
LGTLSGNKLLVEDFIANNHPDGIQDDEIDAIPDQVEKSSTYFSRNPDKDLILWDYQIKGFFKDACSMMLRVTKVKELRAYKKIIDGLIFVKPRKIHLSLSKDLTFTERPLRAATAQGERIALARSETAPIGTTITIEILLLKPSLVKYIKNWLDYGILRGLGQWRNSGMGRFTWEEVQ